MVLIPIVKRIGIGYENDRNLLVISESEPHHLKGMDSKKGGSEPIADHDNMDLISIYLSR